MALMQFWFMKTAEYYPIEGIADPEILRNAMPNSAVGKTSIFPADPEPFSSNLIDDGSILDTDEMFRDMTNPFHEPIGKLLRDCGLGIEDIVRDLVMKERIKLKKIFRQLNLAGFSTEEILDFFNTDKYQKIIQENRKEISQIG